jgi:hypothetical protein
MSTPERMSVEFFIGWCVDQHHDDDERGEITGGDDSLPAYIQAMWDEVVDQLDDSTWEKVAIAMWHVYDPHHVMHKSHPLGVV